MKIETRFNIGEEVYIVFCKNGVAGAVKCRVVDIEIKCYKYHSFITYGLIATTEKTSEYDVVEHPIPDRYREDYVFPTKEELLKSL